MQSLNCSERKHDPKAIAPTVIHRKNSFCCNNGEWQFVIVIIGIFLIIITDVKTIIMSVHDDKFLTQFMDFKICDEKSSEIIEWCFCKNGFLLTDAHGLRACIRFFKLNNYQLFSFYCLSHCLNTYSCPCPCFRLMM